MTKNKLLTQCWTIARYLTLRLAYEGFMYRAASLAYATLLAIVPLAIVTFSILSFFPLFAGAEKELQALILQNFVAESATIISQHISEFTTHVHNLSKINVVFLIALDILMLYNIQKAFNSVWHAKPKLNISLAFLIYFVVLLLSPVFFGALLVLGTLLYKISHVGDLLDADSLKNLFYFILPHLTIWLTFTFFNWILPSTRVKFRYAALGGVLTTIIFEIAKAGFSFYLAHFKTYQLLYGALAALPLFLIWLYVSWLIILFGALVTHLIAKGISPHWEKQLHDIHK